MTHQECRDRLLELAYGELAPPEATEVEAHLAGCEACRAERAHLEGTRSVMRRLEPEPPPEHGQHLLLTAARQAAERRRQRRTFLPPWAWRLSLTVAALLVVGGISLRILSLQGRRAMPGSEGPRVEPFAAPVEKTAPAPAAGTLPGEPARSAPPDIGQGTADRGAVPPPQPAERRPARRRPETDAIAKEEVLAAAPSEPPAGEAEAQRRPLPSTTADGSAQAPPPAPQSVAPLATPAPEAPLLSARTWQQDRRVRAVQRLVRGIDEAQRRRQLAELDRPFQACGAGQDAERRLYQRGGRTVKYVRQVGQSDLSLTIEQYYDDDGRLRYLFAHGGAVNGAVVEHRLWLDEEGRRLWEAQRWRRHRYPLPAVWPERQLTRLAPDAATLECAAP